MDPFLSISFIMLEGVGQVRPLAGYSEIYMVLPSSAGELEVETSLLGRRSLRPGESLGLSTGRGIVSRLRGLPAASFLRVQLNTPRQQELSSPCWFTAESRHEDESVTLVSPDLSERGVHIARACVEAEWQGEEEKNYIVYDPARDAWCAASQLSETGWYWFFGGRPLQEPVDPFSSLAMSDRMRNRLVIECYKKGLLGQLTG